MDINDYLLDVTDVDWSTTLSPWLFLVPGEMTIWLVNRYGDIFAVLEDGSIHMLDVGAGTFARVANSRDDFCNMLDMDDNANQWLMIPLINKLVAAGKRLQNGYCYGYLQPPVLGGDYTVENTIMIPITEHYGLNASIHTQIKDLPDGSAVRLKIAND
ncbi:MAG: DUF1851 domain-containing protein [Parvibaculaceae bacterium]